MSLEAGDTIIINDREYTVHYGPWRYENKKTSKSGFGLYVRLNDSNEWGVWINRCGIRSLKDFGLQYEVKKDGEKAEGIDEKS